jgi:hypothetical protein
MKLFNRSERGMETIETETIPLISSVVKIYRVNSMMHPAPYVHAHFSKRKENGELFTLSVDPVMANN